ncbi:MAG TPA: YbjN domain-containing protein [Candidatus Angelobacter sp.]|nr:YbjN domain-containing protein [Candidatus Angelobacter sp.]
MAIAMTDKTINAKEAFETLRKVLTEIEWANDADEENASFYIDFGAPHSPVSDAVVAIAMEAEQFLFYVNIGPMAPVERRDEVARFISRVNWGLSIGNFEMDDEYGFVRFRSSVAFANAKLTEPLIRNAILAAMEIVEVYAEPVIDVLARGKSVQEAWLSVKAKRI